MGDEEKILVVRAGSTHKTYIGADFCSRDSGLADIIDSVNPLLVVDINLAREAVQGGMAVAQAMNSFELNAEVNSKQRLIRSCLGQIAAGHRQVYPPRDA